MKNLQSIDISFADNGYRVCFYPKHKPDEPYMDDSRSLVFEDCDGLLDSLKNAIEHDEMPEREKRPVPEGNRFDPGLIAKIVEVIDG